MNEGNIMDNINNDEHPLTSVKIIEISEENRNELGLYFDINENQLFHCNEPEPGLFVVESPMVIERALAAGYIPVSFVMVDKVAEEMCRNFYEIMKKAGTERELDTVPVYVADYDTIAGLTGVNITRGVLALMKRRSLPKVSELLKGGKRIAVFDDVENPTNVGAMFRSAAALGIDAVILTGATSDPLYRRASRVSVGTVFQIPWTRTGKKGQQNDYIRELHELGYKTVAMALSDNSIDISDPVLKQERKLAILMGNEGAGLKDEIITSSDYVAKIPMKNDVDSLNVAAAASIIFWELTR